MMRVIIMFNTHVQIDVIQLRVLVSGLTSYMYKCMSIKLHSRSRVD